MPDRLGPRRRALAANLEHDARVVFEVVIPSGMIVEPRIGGDDDVPAVGLEVPDRCDSTLPRLPSRCCQQEHGQTLDLSPDSAARQTIEGSANRENQSEESLHIMVSTP